ncbi:MAG: hypothetical protein AB1757_16565 [Acidobacteriota bacterium]
MNSIVKTNENGDLYLPSELLGDAAKYQEFSLETTGETIVLRPVSSSKAAWESRTPEERAAAFRRWAESHHNQANLPDEALRRENIYD